MLVCKVLFNPIRILIDFNFPQARIFAIHVNEF